MKSKDKLAVVLTARCGSERLPNKAIAVINGKPLMKWIIERYKMKGFHVILGTTTLKADGILVRLAQEANIPWYRYSEPDDVLTRMHKAVEAHMPDARFVFRALGDCPFYATELLEHVVKRMDENNAEAFKWVVPPEQFPIYGAREFPYHMNAFIRIHKASRGAEREHVDRWYSNNLHRFHILYHEPPASVYFRPTYRVEVDYQEDIDFVRQVAKDVGMTAPLSVVMKYLDANPDVVAINSRCKEVTGPMVSYTYEQRRGWFKEMVGKPILDWQGNLWEPPGKKAMPIFCYRGRCTIGYGWKGKLHRQDGSVLAGPDYVSCNCGSGRIWRPVH